MNRGLAIQVEERVHPVQELRGSVPIAVEIVALGAIVNFGNIAPFSKGHANAEKDHIPVGNVGWRLRIAQNGSCRP